MKILLFTFTVALLIWLSAVKTNAQIVYTDIDPDTTIYLPDVPWNFDSLHYFPIDLNGNDTIDINITIRNYYQYSGGPNFGKSLYILRETDGYVSGGCAIGGVREDISSGDTINENLYWDEIKYLFHSLNFMSFTCELPVADTYFGLMIFTGTDTLYGWVRCSATDTSITIKDYAYNTIPNSYILAGQTILGTNTLTLNNNINVYESNRILNINLSNTKQAQGVIRLYNNTGVLIKSIKINGTYNSIALTGITSGIYVVRVELPTGTVNKQFYFSAR